MCVRWFGHVDIKTMQIWSSVVCIGGEAMSKEDVVWIMDDEDMISFVLSQEGAKVRSK